MHFGITEKPTTDCVSLRYILMLALSLKVSEEIASKNIVDNHCCLTPLPREPPRISA